MTPSVTSAKVQLPLSGGKHKHTNGFASVHILVYDNRMKKRDVENVLRRSGWTFLRHGRRHDIWTDGDREEAIPRHVEINEKLARAILRKAERKA